MVAFNVNGSGFKGARVAAVKSQGATGYASGGTLWTPDRNAVAALLPYRWRAAFRRAGSGWYDKHNNQAPTYWTVRGARGAYLTTVYAHPMEGE